MVKAARGFWTGRWPAWIMLFSFLLGNATSVVLVTQTGCATTQPAAASTPAGHQAAEATDAAKAVLAKAAVDPGSVTQAEVLAALKDVHDGQTALAAQQVTLDAANKATNAHVDAVAAAVQPAITLGATVAGTAAGGPLGALVPGLVGNLATLGIAWFKSKTGDAANAAANAKMQTDLDWLEGELRRLAGGQGGTLLAGPMIPSKPPVG